MREGCEMDAYEDAAVYFAHARSTGWSKVGWSTCPWSRLDTLTREYSELPHLEMIGMIWFKDLYDAMRMESIVLRALYQIADNRSPHDEYAGVEVVGERFKGIPAKELFASSVEALHLRSFHDEEIDGWRPHWRAYSPWSPPRDFMTTAAAAALVGQQPARLTALRRRGLIESVQYQGRHYWTADALDYLRRHPPRKYQTYRTY